MRLTRLDYLFWAAGFIFNLTLLIILVYRRRFRTFPFFTALISLVVAKTAILYLVRAWANPHDYFYAYWSLTVADTLLQLCVACEVAWRIFRPLHAWAADIRGVLSAVLVVSVAAAGALAWLAIPVARTWVQALTTRGDLFSAALMSELFVAMMVVSVSAGLPWRSHAAAIAQGLGGYCLLSVLIETGHAYFGTGRDLPAFVILSQVRMVVYLGCVLYWIVNLSPEERPARMMTSEMHTALCALQEQLTGDLRILYRKNK
jgi:hypothetical protein